ncbi:MAG: DUF3575 domain-containing protein [Bacteroidales bacterium]|nr:DUF3575 domain-containing protein [Bacteroidales bacterium]
MTDLITILAAASFILEPLPPGPPDTTICKCCQICPNGAAVITGQPNVRTIDRSNIRFIDQGTLEYDLGEYRYTVSGRKKTVPDRREPVIAIGTNALYDILISPDVNIEIPIGDRWSIYLDHVFPWWVARDNSAALQIFRPEAGFRYWYGDRQSRPVLSGWWTGAAAGAGYGDLETGGRGVQWDSIFLSACGGYSFDVGRGWRIGLGASAGFVLSRYAKYSGYNGNTLLIKTSQGRSLWFGPTGAMLEVQKIIFKRNSSRRP